MVNFKYCLTSLIIHLFGLSIATQSIPKNIHQKENKEKITINYLLEQKNTNKEYLHYADKIGKEIKYTPEKQQQNLETKVDILGPTSKPSEQQAYSENQEENQITYNERLRSELCKYFSEEDKRFDVWNILYLNRNNEYMLNMEITIDEKGNFKITKIEHDPNFKDKNNKVLEHYKKFFGNFNNGEYISPKEHNLETPNRVSAPIGNPLYKD